MGYILDWYYEIQYGEPLTNSEIESWANLSGIKLQPFEARCLIELDRERARIANEQFNASLKN